MPGVRGNGDGRVQRGRRNREAVVDALLTLVASGDLKPTATAIADQAGISRRSVFQHFADVEAIYKAAAERVAAALQPLLGPVDATAPLGERLDQLLARRRALFVVLDPIARAARVREPFSEQLTASRQRLSATMRDQCRLAFSIELAAQPPREAASIVDAVAAATSWSVWDHLRSDLGLGDEAADSVVRRLVTAVLQMTDLSGHPAGHPAEPLDLDELTRVPRAPQLAARRPGP